MMYTVWLVPLMFTLSIAGLGYYLMEALGAGAEAYSREFTASAARQLEDLFVFIPPRRILELATGAALLCFFVVFASVSGFAQHSIAPAAVLGGAAAALGWNVPGLILRVLKKRRIRRFNEQLVDGLVTMSNALKAGFSIMQSFESVARQELNPISQEFSVFLHQTRVGVKMDDALGHLQGRVGSSDLTLMVSAIETARLTGGNLPEVFEKIAQTIRERMRIERRILTLTAQGRLQGIVVGLMPIVLGLLLFLFDPRMMMRFVTAPIGMILLGVVGILEICGALLIRKIVRIDV